MATTRPYHRSELHGLWDLKGQGPQGGHRYFSHSVAPRVYVVGGYQDLHLLLLQPDLLAQPHSLSPKLTSPLAPSSPAIVQNPPLAQSAHQPPGFPLCQEPEKKCKVVKGTHGRYQGWNSGITTYSLCNLGQLRKFWACGLLIYKREKNKTSCSGGGSIFKCQRHGKLSLTAFVDIAFITACPCRWVGGGNSMK